MSETIRCALAVGDDGKFMPKHFGDSHRFLIYELSKDGIVPVSEQENIHRHFDEGVEHGSRKKGEAIIEFLSGEGVQVLVSQQFGKNIQVINRHFVPVVISTDDPEEAVSYLLKYASELADEINGGHEFHALFNMRDGELKIKHRD